MASCIYSHSNSLTDIAKKHGVRIWAGSSTYVAVCLIAAKLFKSDLKVVGTVAGTTALGYNALCIIDHRYYQDEEKSHSIIRSILPKGITLFLTNLLVISYFSNKGQPISKLWALATVAPPFYAKMIQIINHRMNEN